ncbi:MAG: response regulator transcription factor [Bacteroidetes bacterium]|nr:response regulator transcription factor [Bacteroidota bacterium]
MKILIGDDHSVVRKGLIQILKDAYPFAEIIEAADGVDMFKIALKQKFKIIISDISMPSRNGIDFISELKNAQPETPILILSIHPAEQYAARTIKAGASGYLNKESAPEELINAVNQLLLGKKYITDEVADLLLDFKSSNTASHEMLSNREFEVFKLLAAGKSLPEISTKLALSTNTISTYKIRLLTKMNLKSIADVTKYALENHLM